MSLPYGARIKQINNQHKSVFADSWKEMRTENHSLFDMQGFCNLQVQLSKRRVLSGNGSAQRGDGFVAQFCAMRYEGGAAQWNRHRRHVRGGRRRKYTEHPGGD